MKRFSSKWLPYLAVLLLYPAGLYLLFAPTGKEEFALLEKSSPSDLKGPRLSPYDDIIQKHAGRNGIDWRLIASMIFAESSFREDAVSPAGARGLMQLMPAVAREHGVREIFMPEENIRAGVRHLRKKLRLIRGETADDVIRLSVAAYNSGLGHVRDAQNLALRLGRNPRRWKNVREMLLLLEDPQYYRQAKYGYCRGSETVDYVSKIIQRYHQYLSTYPSTPIDVTSRDLNLLDPGV